MAAFDRSPISFCSAVVGVAWRSGARSGAGPATRSPGRIRSREYCLGWRMNTAAGRTGDFEVRLDRTRREDDAGEEHGIGLRAGMRCQRTGRARTRNAQAGLVTRRHDGERCGSGPMLDPVRPGVGPAAVCAAAGSVRTGVPARPHTGDRTGWTDPGRGTE